MIEKNKWLTLAASCIAIFVIGKSLISFYNTFILLALLIPVARIADFKGNKKLFCIGAGGYALATLLLFLLLFNTDFLLTFTSSFMYSLSTSSPFFYLVFIVRGLQDLFLAMLIPTSMALLINVFPDKQRGVSLAIYFAVLGIGILYSDVILNTLFFNFHFTNIFRERYFIESFLALTAAVFCYYTVNNRAQPLIPVPQRIDWLGLLLITGCSVYLNHLLPVVFLILLLLFIVTEKLVKRPLLPLSIFKNRELLAAIIVYSCGTIIAALLILYPWHFMGDMTGILALLLVPATTIILTLLAGYFHDKQNRYLTIHMSFILCIVSTLGFIILTLERDAKVYDPQFTTMGIILTGVYLLSIVTWTVCATTSLSIGLSNSCNKNRQSALFSSVIFVCGIISAKLIVGIPKNLIHNYIIQHAAMHGIMNAHHIVSAPNSPERIFIAKVILSLLVILLIAMVIAWLGCYLLLRKRHS